MFIRLYAFWLNPIYTSVVEKHELIRSDQKASENPRGILGGLQGTRCSRFSISCSAFLFEWAVSVPTAVNLILLLFIIVGLRSRELLYSDRLSGLGRAVWCIWNADWPRVVECRCVETERRRSARAKPKAIWRPHPPGQPGLRRTIRYK